MRTSEYTKTLSDAQDNFEAAQAILVKTVAEKTTRVDELEASVAELRQSHEKASKEAQDQLAKVQLDLDAATKDRDGRIKEIEDLKATHSAEIAHIKEAIKMLRAQADDNAAKVAALEGVRDELTKSLALVEGEREAARSEHATAQREAEQAKTDLEAFQQSSKGRESEAMTSFKTELDKERHLRSKAESALEEATKEAQARAISSAEEKDRLEKSLADANDKIATAETDVADAERRIAEAELAHETSKKEADATAKVQHDELNAKIAALTTESDGHRTAGKELVAQIAQVKAQLEEKSASHDEVWTQLSDVKSELENKSALYNEASSKLEAFKAEMEEKAAALESATRERDDIKAEVETKSAAHDEAARKLETELEENAKLLDDAVRERDEIKASLEKATTLNDKTSRELKALQEQLAEKAAAHTETEGQLAATKTELVDKISALDDATAKVGSLSEQLAEKTKAHADTEGQLASIKNELEDKATSLVAATTEIDSLRAGANVADSIRAELDDHRRLLEEEKAEGAKISALHATASARGDTLASEADEAKSALAAEKEAHALTSSKLSSTDARIAALEAELATSRKEREELSTQLQASTTSQAELESKLDSAHKDLSNIATQLESVHNSTRSAAETHRDEVDKLASEVEAHKRTAAAAELRIASLTADSTLKTTEMADELAWARSQLEVYKKAQGDLKDSLMAVEKEQAKAVETMRVELASVKDARKAAESKCEGAERELASVRGLLADSKKALDTAAAGKSKALEAAAGSLQKELTLARSEYAAVRARCDRLATELVEAHANNKGRTPRQGLSSSASVPGFLSTAGAQALRGRGGMATPDIEGWRRSHASEEIGRLDKVVEAQKAVIEEQRVKIGAWADELDKQREAVRLLTADIEGCTCGLNGAGLAPDTPKRQHMRASLSMSSVPSPSSATVREQGDLENLSPAPSGYSSARTRGHISSTFTARNLALPSAPSPLPMHTGQFSNTLRKHRRVTLEHDINRLQGELGRVRELEGGSEGLRLTHRGRTRIVH